MVGPVATGQLGRGFEPICCFRNFPEYLSRIQSTHSLLTGKLNTKINCFGMKIDKLITNFAMRVFL